MKYLALLSLLLCLPSPVSAQWTYPATKTVDASDAYFGKTYKDPYRWLEDLKDKQVESWFKAQADLTDRALAKIPGRKALVDEWMALDKLRPVSYGGITYENGRVFYKKTLGGENVGKLYVREGTNGAEKLLFDPDTYNKGSKTVVQSFLPSWDGKHVALGLSAGGAEWSELRVLDVDAGSLLPERIYPTWAASGWAPDSRSFFYDASNVTDIKSMDIELNRQTRVHKLGTKVDEDFDILGDQCTPALGISAREIPQTWVEEACPDYVLGQISTVQKETRMFFAPASDLQSGKASWRVACKLSDDVVDLVADHDYFYGMTHAGAPRFKVVRTPVKGPDWVHAETVIPEAADTVASIHRSRHFLFAVFTNGVVGRVVQYELATGKKTDVKLPASGSVFLNCPDANSDLCHVVITSWTSPPTRYDYDAAKETIAKSAFDADVTYPGFDELTSEEVEAPGHDGTSIPLSIIHRKDLKLDGSTPCILEGYGAYGMSMPPHFAIQYSVVLRGVVLAYAHPRGGGEKGEAWYKAGYKTTKPNTWKDFISCAEYLVKNRYTSPDKLAGTGTSAGGILISRAVTERPDLFRAAVCNVGCANAMRMEFSPNGPVNAPEFGTVKDAVECQALYEMDGVQHVQKGVKYPAVLGVAGWNDPRVAPWEPGKFVAALQNATAADSSPSSTRPVFLKVNYDNGHFTEEKQVTFNNFAGQAAFLLWQTGHKDFQPVE